MEQGIVATWHDGKSAQAHTVLVRLCPQGQVLSFYPLAPAEDAQPGQPPVHIPTTPCIQWNLKDVVLVSATANELPVRCALKEDTGQRLVIHQPEAAAAFLSWHKPEKTKHQRRRVQRWMAATLGLWALGVFLYLGSPLLTQMIVAVIPASWEQRLGESALQQFLAVHALVDNSKKYVVNPPALQPLVQRLAAANNNQGYTYTITVLHSPTVNALALPGGQLLVFSGLIQDAKTPEELAGVLAHEMAHVTQRHGMNAYIRAILWNTFLQLMGSPDAVSSNLGGIAVTMMHSRYSQSAERESDLLAIERLHNAHIHTQGLETFFTRHKEKEEGETPTVLQKMLVFLGSHPPLTDRIQYLHNATQGLNTQNTTPALTEGEWQELRNVFAVKAEGKQKIGEGENNQPKAEKENIPPPLLRNHSRV
ncbi:M48 family metallopeptidase [Desulfovibrio cuneatus]|uniref:M48 family metallopeptidase n=1 Tax=Desulfovibrio cuneatus TaxID=159728 RepID=UPI000488CF23|nr:M48 family metallopeptidase [Desulfovibrio cuneatus]